MKRLIFSAATLIAMIGIMNAQTPEQVAHQQAQSVCQSFGYQKAEPTTQEQSHGSVNFGTSSNSGTQNVGAQNTYNGNLGGNAKVPAGAISGSVQAGAGITRQGSQTNTNTQNQSSNSGTLYFKCE